jgi:uncharacterized protein YndB with AHSA1/START domain
MADPSPPTLPDEVSLQIEAPPERVYEILTDIAQMGRLSPECTGGKWLDGATGPAVGARFKGSNKRGIARWSTTNEVVEADPGKAFSFETKQSAARWTYRLQPDGSGTLVTESRAMFKERPMIAKVYATLMLGGIDDHDDEMRDGMRRTLERLKAIAEAG